MTSLTTERPYLRIEATRFAQRTVQRCAGEIDPASADCLLRALTAAIQGGSPEVEVDLREVSYLDSTAIQVLLEAYQILHSKGRSLPVRANPRHAKLFHLLQLDRILPVRGDAPVEIPTVC